MRRDLATSGYAKWPHRLTDEALAAVARLFEALPATQPGIRIDPGLLDTFPALVDITAAAATMVGDNARPVRALLFDKHDGSNWGLGWHQDRTIEVAERVEADGFGPFTVKQGRLHVAPPISVIEHMLTVRIHVDAVDADNGPLVVIPGSHRLGYIAEDTIGSIVEARGEYACFADAGEVWFYSTPILHRSSRAAPSRRRRVLQIDYAHDPLPGGLRWGVDG
jgi:hypothetical protein